MEHKVKNTKQRNKNDNESDCERKMVKDYEGRNRFTIQIEQ